MGAGGDGRDSEPGRGYVRSTGRCAGDGAARRFGAGPPSATAARISPALAASRLPAEQLSLSHRV